MLRAKRMTPPRPNSRASDRSSGGIDIPANRRSAADRHGTTNALGTNIMTRRSGRRTVRAFVQFTRCTVDGRTIRTLERSGRYNLLVRIDSSAPTRIDLAGGTIDIWPLYLFHDGAQTLNAAISLRARRCDPSRATDRRHRRSSPSDTGRARRGRRTGASCGDNARAAAARPAAPLLPGRRPRADDDVASRRPAPASPARRR